MIYDIIVLSEGLIKSAQVNHDLEDQAQTAHARADVSDELLRATKERERKSREKISLLEAKLVNLANQQRKKKGVRKAEGWLSEGDGVG